MHCAVRIYGEMKKWKSQERGIDQENMPEEVTGPSSGSPRVSVTLESEGVAKIQSSLAFVRDTSPMPESSTSHNIVSTSGLFFGLKLRVYGAP